MNETIKLTPNDIQTIKVDKDEAAKLIKHFANDYRRDIEALFTMGMMCDLRSLLLIIQLMVRSTLK